MVELIYLPFSHRAKNIRLTKQGTMPISTVLCLGNFDGVHLAHRALLQSGLRFRDEHFPNALCGVFSFLEPSSDVLQTAPPQHLCTNAQKAERFCDVGMDFAILVDFSSVKDLTPLDFVTDILKIRCGCVAAACGFNYRFGKNAAGTAQILSDLFGGATVIQSELQFDGTTVSSTRIRTLLADAEIEEANRLLTLPYGFSAPVLHGKQLGRRLGIPTINQDFPNRMLIPAHGVYVSECKIAGTSYRGISNIGVHPTVDTDQHVNCETFLFDFNEEIYNQIVTTSFLSYLRPEQTFENQDILRQQIQSDIEQAKRFSRELKF